jgi:hypothetical protein
MNTHGGAGRRPRSLACRPIGDPAACPELGIDLRSVRYVGRVGSLAPVRLALGAHTRLTECEARL